MAQLYGPAPGGPPPLVMTSDLAGLRASDVEDRPVGELVATLSEKSTGMIRYLDLELARTAKHVLIPIGHARIHTAGLRPRVRLRAATYEDLLGIPDYAPGDTELDLEYHERLLESHGRLFYGSHYYAHPSFDHLAMFAGDSPVLAEPGEPELDEAELTAVQPLSQLKGARADSATRALHGRPATDSAGEAVGEVADMLVEPATGTVRYVVIRLPEPPRLIVLPIGYLQDPEAGATDGRPAAGPDDRALRPVVLHGLAAEDASLLPAFEGTLTRRDENRVRAAVEGLLGGQRTFQRPDFRVRDLRTGGR